MPFPLFDFKSGREIDRRSSGRIYDDLCRELRSVGQTNPAFPDLCDRHAEQKLCSARLCAPRQKKRRTRRIQHSVFRNEKATCQSRAEVWLQTMQSFGVEHLRRNSALAVVISFAEDLDHPFLV